MYDLTRTKGFTAQQAFDYYVENRPVAKVEFSEDEIALMRDFAQGGRSTTEAAKALNRPVKSVRKKAVELGISFHSVRRLTDEELAWFKENFGSMTYQKMAEILHVDIRTLQYHGKRMGLTKSQSAAAKKVRRYAGKITVGEISEVTGISVNAVLNVACENRIPLACPERSGRRPWTEQEDEVLRSHCDSEGYKALSKRLGTRTPGVVRTRLKVLGLR